ncbi:DUF3093 domain-containing protein [Paenarthrobacter aurescens]|uniref:DUF3093 domain-containing protein n=1 Tax=Paenarthrobacter aurescens TaxID=43663 RepID=A0A4Y3N9Z5_PAEAU|nr:DUF3093 domain-containing protein [Paenarthrobacter aurescens]MDO6143290.1 DUF3093 domain-containing protein [Paenarthrobacter aurescens]MDO6147138.1 DUF3093 domain-containing protein [Paenarthrobacter aurescens]MDO6158382.1 DUF3093 domain-containing protein [Paenarthrobacter aurescens]MDO6162366.1 DUF3093 domain-containing protein [Paenarthrobacter aurescens]GEB18103.1 hypothetical protein AAU01_08580 [Paenarthrobacter aurescens]
MPTSDQSSPVPARNTPSASEVLYTEKLWPSVWIWIVVVGLSGAGVLMFGPISAATGIIAALILLAIMTIMLVLSTPTITVTPETVRVGRASIDRKFVGAVEAFEKSEATAERGPRLNGLAYMCFRGWIDPVVKIEITDPADRTPYWLASTRRPEELVAALTVPKG